MRRFLFRRNQQLGIAVLGEDEQRLLPGNHWDRRISGKNFTQWRKIGKLAFIGGRISADNRPRAIGKGGNAV